MNEVKIWKEVNKRLRVDEGKKKRGRKEGRKERKKRKKEGR